MLEELAIAELEISTLDELEIWMELEMPVLDESGPSALLETGTRDDEESCSLGVVPVEESSQARRNKTIAELKNMSFGDMVSSSVAVEV